MVNRGYTLVLHGLNDRLRQELGSLNLFECEPVGLRTRSRNARISHQRAWRLAAHESLGRNAPGTTHPVGRAMPSRLRWLPVTRHDRPGAVARQVRANGWI